MFNRKRQTRGPALPPEVLAELAEPLAALRVEDVPRLEIALIIMFQGMLADADFWAQAPTPRADAAGDAFYRVLQIAGDHAVALPPLQGLEDPVIARSRASIASGLHRFSEGAAPIEFALRLEGLAQGELDKEYPNQDARVRGLWTWTLLAAIAGPGENALPPEWAPQALERTLAAWTHPAQA